MKKTTFTIFCFFVLFLCAHDNLYAQAGKGSIKVSYQFNGGYFPLFHQHLPAKIYIDPVDAEVVKVAGSALQNDLKLITGTDSKLAPDKQLSTYPVIIGTIGKSVLIDQLMKAGKISVKEIKGKWETFSIAVIAHPFKNVKQALVIYGSDPRGTAFGVFELSRLMGISPLVWWADVKPTHHDGIYITPGKSIFGPPSVKYRGIFLNDEDWGLRPWAALNMDPDKKDIGPKTYKKVFELLLRLKANYIWPAMHPGTKAFWYDKENPAMARKYDIIMGSSHHEPMLRDTEFEWNENYKEEYGKDHGEWRYDTNKDEIYRFFDDRVKESVGNDAYYTVGMRSTKDGAMAGPTTVEGKIKILEDVIHDQRRILANRLRRPAAEIPQVFCPYKEVLPLYRAGLKLPDDVTITWVDDNHGYIRQLPNPKEQQRSGGNGIYYHLSYWGSPQDYLWLCSTSPSLISSEMSKAYHFKANRMWVFNVGDLKPAEMETQFALDLAWDVKAWTPEKASQYAFKWAAETFGEKYAARIAAIKSTYYRLAAAGKPEHLDKVIYTSAEIGARLKDYQELALQVEDLSKEIPKHLLDAYFELILYPVEGAKLMNEKVLYSRESAALAASNSSIATEYVTKAKTAYDQIQVLTKKYNEEIAGGKWNGIMSSHPRDGAIFKDPSAVKAVSSANVSGVDNRSNIVSVLAGDQQIQIIPSSAYVRKQDYLSSGIKTIEGLGLGGKGITVLPIVTKSFSEKQIATAPYVEYKVQLLAGKTHVMVKCLPTFNVYDGLSMRYGITLNGEAVKIVDLMSLAETKPWAVNVLRGYTQGETTFKVDKSGETTLRIYLLDPGLVINQIEITGMK